MSDYKPTKPYIYQPDPPFKQDGSPNRVIFALAGPGADDYFGKRFTREDAERELQSLNRLLERENP